MNKRFLTLLILPLLASCGNVAPTGPNESQLPEVTHEVLHYYAYFMYNYPRTDSTSPTGNPEYIDNGLYCRVEIDLNTPFNKPTDPSRDNYLFGGWFRESRCEHAWNFTSDIATSSVFLYAKWTFNEEEHHDEYVEPEYVYPETIITDENYRLTGILNAPIEAGSVNLTAGAIKRLENNKEDVSFAINYERKETTNLTVATYNTDTKTVHLETNTGETFNVVVNDVTASKTITSSIYYEEKAVNYEANGGDIENYHIALAGSSSMENWATSTEDMAPIVTFNHGIGGTSAEEWRDHLFERLVMPYSPKAVVYYVGVNDIINRSKSGAATANYLTGLFDKTHQYLPNTKIFYVLINKLPNFLSYQDQFDTANNAAINYASTHSYLTCINAGKDLVNPDNGRPLNSYFLNDGLHMSKYGYVIWGAAVKEAIINWLDSTK